VGIIVILFTWLLAGTFALLVIYYGVKYGIDNSQTSKDINKILQLLEENNKKDEN
jgi:TM2 domain-containing membrane protein YozV